MSLNCIIVEDEQHAAELLEYKLLNSGYDVTVQAKLESVSSTVAWLTHNTTDLIFLDIELEDGNSFEIFDHVQVKTPVIFTTSFDNYAIQAFRLNSIAYLLKPFNTDELTRSIQKYVSLYENKLAPEESINNKILSLFTKNYQTRFLVKSGSVFLSVSEDDVAYMHYQNRRYVFIVTKQNQHFLYDSTMETLEKRLNPVKFFRINRQFIVNQQSIAQMHLHDRGRFKIETNPECKEEMIVSINKISDFKEWLNG